MPEVLTPIERRIYNFLVDYLKRETFQPSIREIGSHLGIRSTKTVTDHLESLERKGYLDRTPSRSRGLKILGLDLSPQTYTVPVYTDAGPDSEADSRYDLDRALACSPDCFMIRVSGDHLGAVGILDGDMLLVEPCTEELPGGAVVVLRGGHVELRSAGTQDGDGTEYDAGRRLGIARALVRRLPGAPA